ncbi:DUF982 domain-containing protein [Shinella sp. CPCC 100929]|uniref:DUF982 domain-containing protein n=1 Tax=Shinella lacus TaxID=2654216 RepID=A0ABT1R9C6_9HYPH|nr:DUF982 domain-containing protein [Shinella lacus]MCQ4631661.1 DUF982 domain-containing protein [Shinella lacus]
METGRWNDPITFETHKLGAYLTISSTAEAARVLLDHWPLNHGKALKRAKAACLAVLQGTEDPEVARKAFLKAAEEAGVSTRQM